MSTYKYQLVAQFGGDSISDFDAMIELENSLIDGLGDAHDVDGHDVGSGEINIFIHTNDPELAFTKVRDVLAATLHEEVKIAYRPLSGDNYTVLWPPGQNHFSIA